jgi:hypothetical protein
MKRIGNGTHWQWNSNGPDLPAKKRMEAKRMSMRGKTMKRKNAGLAGLALIMAIALVLCAAPAGPALAETLPKPSEDDIKYAQSTGQPLNPFYGGCSP